MSRTFQLDDGRRRVDYVTCNALTDLLQREPL